MKLASKFSSLAFKARKEQGYTQSEVAEAISVSVRWYQKVESGRKLPGTLTALRILLFLGIDIEELREEVGLVVPVRTIRRTFTFK